MIVLIVIGFIFLIIGIVGCILPGMAGPPFSFLALILLSIAKKWEAFSIKFLLIMAGITLVVMALDYVMPAAGAKKFGSSRAGFWGAMIGMIVGLVYAPPLGMIIGAFLGAFIAEYTAGKPGIEALRAGWGVFIGVMVAMVSKLVASGIMTFYFIKAL
ncbi:MAG: DUF456 domain-containing protein [Acidobacteriota bacterium]